jgi:geranylgeranyl diphosphate synthase type II
LYLKALENLEGSEKEQLLTLFTTPQANLDLKVETTKNLFIKSKAVDKIQQEIKDYTQKAFDVLEGVSISVSTKEDLIAFGHYLMGRKV